MLTHVATEEEAYGWIMNDPGYVEHEISQAVREIASRARNRRHDEISRGRFVNESDTQCVEGALKAVLNEALHPYGLHVVRRRGYRELMA